MHTLTQGLVTHDFDKDYLSNIFFLIQDVRFNLCISIFRKLLNTDKKFKKAPLIELLWDDFQRDKTAF